MKILIYIRPDFKGCGLYRQFAPYYALSEYEDIHVKFANSLTFSDNELKEYDILQAHKDYINIPGFQRCKDLGLKVIIDFDDYWMLPQAHSMYKQYKERDQTGLFTQLLKFADVITTTTPLMKKECELFNKKVLIVPNGIDPTKPQYEVKPTEHDKIRFGWIGGAYHLPDIEMMRIKEVEGSEFRLFGYVKGTIYDDYLKHFKAKPYPVRQVFTDSRGLGYQMYYNDIDVSLVPLLNNKFNSLKSELKLIEAGFFKKPCIVSDCMPYGLVEGNIALRVGNRGWQKAIKKMMNADLRAELAENLHEAVKEKYDLRNIVKELKNELLNL